MPAMLSPRRSRLWPLLLILGLLTGLLPNSALIAQETAPTSVSFPGSYAVSDTGGPATFSYDRATNAVGGKEVGIVLTAPEAPVIDAVEEGSGVVTLTIAIPPLTSRVEVYRSFVDGSFQPVGVIEASDRGKTVTFVDEGLPNGQPVYYRAVAFNDVGVASEPSRSMQAVPHAPITDARLLEPTTVEQVIGATKSRDLLQAVVTVADVTDGEGAGLGILARAGYAPAAFDGPATALPIRWVEAEYAGEMGDGDLYAAALLPDALGDYLYGFIFSTTGGRDWVYADTAGMGVGMGEGVPWARPGKLTVISGDGRGDDRQLCQPGSSRRNSRRCGGGGGCQRSASGW